MGDEYTLVVEPVGDGRHDDVRQLVEDRLGMRYDHTDEGILVFEGVDVEGSPDDSLADDDRVEYAERMTMVHYHEGASMYTGKYYECRFGDLELVERPGLGVPASPEWTFEHFLQMYGIHPST